MSVQEIFASGGGLLLVIMTLVQISPIKINPWSWFGKAINADLSNRLTEIEKKLDQHIDMDDQRTANTNRARILHFNNELIRDIGHTKEEFIEVLAEIDTYETYCKAHDDYKNNRAILAIENIRENYRERLKRRDFLQEGSVTEVKA